MRRINSLFFNGGISKVSTTNAGLLRKIGWIGPGVGAAVAEARKASSGVTGAAVRAPAGCSGASPASVRQRSASRHRAFEWWLAFPAPPWASDLEPELAGAA